MMSKKEANKYLKKLNEQQKVQRKIKTYKDEFYTVNSILGNDWAKWFYLLGGREAGKSYSVMRWATLRKLRDPDNVKLYWFRLTEEQQRKLLTGNAKDFIDPDLRDKFNLKTETLGNTVYTYREVTVVNEKTGKTTVKKEDKREFCRVMCCSTFYSDKGVGYFDNSYKGEYICVLDEMNREKSEKNCFDIVYNFSN